MLFTRIGRRAATGSFPEAPAIATHTDDAALGVHPRGTGPGDRVSLPYFSVPDMAAALERVRALGGEVIHPGERWSVCRDSEGSPFGLGADPREPALE